jgi:hypothetical protein
MTTRQRIKRIKRLKRRNKVLLLLFAIGLLLLVIFAGEKWVSKIIN